MSDRPFLSDEACAVIMMHTEPVRPRVLPELTLQLVTPAKPWWTSQPDDLLALGVVDPYWAFCWAGGTGLARYLLDEPQLVRGQRVLDIGAGCGVVALAARLAGAAEVTANDIDPWALQACRINAQLNGLTLTTDGTNLIGAQAVACDVVVLGDMTYSKDLVAELWPWLEALHQGGTRILLADPGRGFLPSTLSARTQRRVPADIDASGTHWQMVDIFSF